MASMEVYELAVWCFCLFGCLEVLVLLWSVVLFCSGVLCIDVKMCGVLVVRKIGHFSDR